MKRSPIRPRRREPRQRVAPRWGVAEWAEADVLLRLRSGGCCERCGQPLAGRVERAHRQRRRDGGDRLSNLLYLHPACHTWTHANPAAAMESGWIVSVHVPDPASVPVLYRGSRLVLLSDDGSVHPA